VTLFQCASGLFAEASGDYARMRTDEVRHYVPAMPPELATLIVECMSANPNDRVATFDVVLARLETIFLAAYGSLPPADAAPDLPAAEDALRNAAQSWLNVGEWSKALQYAEQAVDRDSGSWRAHNAMGLVHRDAGEHEAALTSFIRAHRLQPDEVPPLANAALTAHDLGAVDQAGQWLLEVLTLAEATGQWNQLDGVSSVIVDRFAPGEALELVDRILAANSRAALTWNNRAVLLRRAQRPGDALVSANRAIAINPSYAQAWSNRATAEVELNRWNDAIASADQASALDPLLSGPYLAKATALAQCGRIADARSCIARALVLKPGDAQLARAQAAFSR
jgi:tetratricopeptide (TPR) repeat protein